VAGTLENNTMVCRLHAVGIVTGTPHPQRSDRPAALCARRPGDQAAGTGRASALCRRAMSVLRNTRLKRS
jgi:hypothetical protein